MRLLKVHGRVLTLSGLDKVMYPGEDVMRGDLLGYYNGIARAILPHLRGRFVTVHRFPEGIRRIDRRDVGMPPGAPPWVRTTRVRGAEHQGRQLVVEEPATIALLPLLDCITPCMWLCPMAAPQTPDRIVFDIDPPARAPARLGGVIRAALTLRSTLDDLGLAAFVLATGSRGLHVHVPIRPELHNRMVFGLARIVAERVVQSDPNEFTTATGEPEAQDKVLIDYMRNAFAMCAVAPYALRARPGAPVATPLYWDEVAPGLDPRRYTIRSVGQRISREGDPWEHIHLHARSVTRARFGPVLGASEAGARAARATTLSDQSVR